MSLKQLELDFIDIHYHAMPDLYIRRHDALEAGRIYKQLNGAVVLKSHLGATSVQATLAQRAGLPVFPSIVLNTISGGIHYKNVLHALSEYHPVFPSKLIVHFPTLTGRKHKSKLKRDFYNESKISQIAMEAETIFNSGGNVRQEVIDVLKMSKDYPVTLSSGHASKEEIHNLIDLCIQFNVDSLMLNQPSNPLTGLKANELLEISQNTFVWCEQTALTYFLNYQDKQDFKTVLNDVPNVIYSSDLGQTTQIDVENWLSQSKHWFSEFEISNERRKQICLNNPLHLLTI